MYSYPEPRRDIAAQVAFLTQDYPKDAVFVAAGNEAEIPPLSPKLLVHRRDEGTFITTIPEKLKRFAEGSLDDRVLAELLDYPRPKLDLIWSGKQLGIAQIRNANDCVIKEAVVNVDCVDDFFASAPVPEGGQGMVISPEAMIWRRFNLLREQGIF